MKKLALALAFGVISMGAVSAQTTQKTKAKNDSDHSSKQKYELKQEHKKDNKKRSPEERAEIQARRLRTQYNLNDVQTAKIKEISLAKATQMESLRSKYGENRKEMAGEMRTVKNNWDNELKAVLTPEQYAQFQKERTEKMEKRKEKHGKHQGQIGASKSKMHVDEDDDDND